MKKGGVLLGVAGLAAGISILVLGMNMGGTSGKAPKYETATIVRGLIEKTVSSSGTLEAVSTAIVLPQMSGTVEKVLADYNDRVRKGQPLVQLNTDMLKLQARGQAAAASKARATYELELLDYQSKTTLAAKAMISDFDLKTSKAALDGGAADLASAEAALEGIQTQINQYANITAPIDGIVLARNVSVGQSVVEGSSANSSSLFTLAADLDRMDVLASVDELDISAIHTRQNVRFSVEARPAETFLGVVQQIRVVPATVNNVVSYSVLITADNRKGKLLPGMTADVVFIEESKANALLVPTAALRYQPSSMAVQKSDSPKSTAPGLTGILFRSAALGGPPPGPPGTKRLPSGPTKPEAAPAPSNPATLKNLWFLDEAGQPQVLQVQVGISNSSLTEIINNEGLEGKAVILKEKVEP